MADIVMILPVNFKKKTPGEQGVVTSILEGYSFKQVRIAADDVAIAVVEEGEAVGIHEPHGARETGPSYRLLSIFLPYE